jgi:hypothetical protein
LPPQPGFPAKRRSAGSSRGHRGKIAKSLLRTSAALLRTEPYRGISTQTWTSPVYGPGEQIHSRHCATPPIKPFKYADSAGCVHGKIQDLDMHGLMNDDSTGGRI